MLLGILCDGRGRKRDDGGGGRSAADDEKQTGEERDEDEARHHWSLRQLTPLVAATRQRGSQTGAVVRPTHVSAVEASRLR